MNFIRKNIKHFINFLSYILEHLLCIVILVIVFIVAFFVLKILPSNMPNEIQSQEIYIFGISLNNFGIWFTAIGLIITAFWSIYQFAKNISRKQQEKGASIAKEFTNGLLDKCGLVTIIYKKSPLYRILNSHQEYNSFRNFTISELRDVYRDELPDIYKNLEDQCELDKIYHSILKSRISPYEANSTDSKPNNKKAAKKNNKSLNIDYDNLFVLDNKNLPYHFDSLVDDVLNELEYICMDISSQAAGSKYIYQSLHQIFFRTIKVLSIEICLRNDGKYCDKYYTNIIHVYNEWTKRYERDLKKEEKRKNRVNKILNPKIKTV